jgi:secreted PhoX family phosphatase
MRSARIAVSLVATVAISFGVAGAAVGGNGHGKGQNTAGPPVPDPAGIIDLPAGYSYDVLARDCVDQVTSTESGGTFKMPADFDANITVPGKGGTVQLLSAHELTEPRTYPAPPQEFAGDAGKCFVPEQAKTDDGDSDGWGSVSRLTLAKDGTTVTKRELITTGLHDLCAGGRTPWGTMLVNEEFPFLQGTGKDRSGWVWEIDPETGAQKRATGMGHFSHEQEALSRGAWYLTDDRGNYQYLYKFVPDKRRDLSQGKLYGLKFDRSTNTGQWIGPLDPMDPEADMAAKAGGPPTAANSFSKHEGIVKAKRGNGVVFSESGSGADPGRIWHLTDRKSGVRGEVLVEGSFAQLSRPDNLRFDRKGNLLLFEDHSSGDIAAHPEIGPDNEVYVLPKGQTGAQNLRKFAQVRNGGEGTGPWFSRNGKILYLSIQDQPRPDGSQSRVLAIHVPKGHGHRHGSRGRGHKH